MKRSKSPRQRQPEKETKITSIKKPAFQTRKTIADYIRDNMLLMGRKSYYQRVIVLTKNLTSDEEVEYKDKLKKLLQEFVTKCNHNRSDEKLTGLYVYYKGYSTIMVEGSEDVVGVFFKQLAEIEKDFYAISKILLVHNNIAKVFFDKFVWRTGESPILLDQFSSTGEQQQMKQSKNLINKVLELCNVLSDELASKEVMYNDEMLTRRYTRNMPEIQRIDFILNSAQMESISELAAVYMDIPEVIDNDAQIWPVPYDYMPFGVFDTSPYDVNLTFKDVDKK